MKKKKKGYHRDFCLAMKLPKALSNVVGMKLNTSDWKLYLYILSKKLSGRERNNSLLESKYLLPSAKELAKDSGIPYNTVRKSITKFKKLEIFEPDGLLSGGRVYHHTLQVCTSFDGGSWLVFYSWAIEELIKLTGADISVFFAVHYLNNDLYKKWYRNENGGGRDIIGIKMLAEKTNLSKPTIIKSLQTLEEAVLINITRNKMFRKNGKIFYKPKVTGRPARSIIRSNAFHSKRTYEKPKLASFATEHPYYNSIINNPELDLGGLQNADSKESYSYPGI